MRNSRLVIPIFALAVTVAVGFFLVQKHPEQSQERDTHNVRTVKISGDLPVRRLRIAGTTESAETTALRFQVGGRVIDNKVRLGDSIAKGDTIAKLYNPELEPLTGAAKDNVARLLTETQQAKRDFARIDALYKDEAVTRAEWEAVRTALTAKRNAQAAAESELARATQVADELSLVAPFGGSITEVMIDVGDVISAGMPAVRISNPMLVELKLAVSDTVVEQLKLGQTILVNRALRPNEPAVQGTISEISPYRERGSLPEIIVTLDAEKIAPGVAVNAIIDVVADRGLSIPTRSVLMTGTDSVAVYKVVEGIARLVPIRPLRLDSDSVLIDQGLMPGDALVIEGISHLYDGARVAEADTADDIQSNNNDKTTSGIEAKQSTIEFVPNEEPAADELVEPEQ